MLVNGSDATNIVFRHTVKEVNVTLFAYLQSC